MIYVVKGGIPSVGHSNNPNFYLLCNDFSSNIGYIEKKEATKWQLYTRDKNLNKLYFQEISFKNCIDKLQEITSDIIEVLASHEAMRRKEFI